MSAKKAAIAIMSKGEVAEKKKVIEETRALLEKGMHYLISKSQEVNKLQVELDALSIADGALEKSLEEVLEDLMRHPYVSEAYFEDEWLCVKTTRLLAYTQGGIAVPIFKGVMKMNLLNAAIKGELLETRFKIDSSSVPRLAPHFMNRGNPCLGDASCTIADLISQQAYYPAMLMLLEFLQGVNENDSAGSSYVRFIDKAKNLLPNWKEEFGVPESGE